MVASFDENTLRALCEILGDTFNGLTGSEISRTLKQQNIKDVEPLITKKHRLYAALDCKQSEDLCANNIIEFLQAVMDPIRYTTDPSVFEIRRSRLNVILVLRGYELLETGKIITVSQLNTLSEAQKKARKLRSKLEERNVHSEVLRFCLAELVVDNYFHAVFEATKSIADRIRLMTGLTLDGAELIDKVFSLKGPLLVVNTFTTETERSEHSGFAMLLKGIFGTFRNVTAHEPKIKWKVSEEDALDLLSMVSFSHRKLDNAFNISTLKIGANP